MFLQLIHVFKVFFWRRKISIISPCCIVVKIFSRGIATIMFFPCCLSRHRLKPLSKSAKCHERAWHQLASASLQRSFHSVDIFGIFHVIPTLTSNPFQPIQLIFLLLTVSCIYNQSISVVSLQTVLFVSDGAHTMVNRVSLCKLKMHQRSTEHWLVTWMLQTFGSKLTVLNNLRETY